MSPSDIAGELNIPHFEDLIDTFLQHQLESQPFKHSDLDSNNTIYTSAIAVFHAPSDICSIHGSEYMWGPGGVSSESPAMIPPMWWPIPMCPVWVGLTSHKSSFFLHPDTATGLTPVHLFIGSQRSVKSPMWILGCGRLSPTLMPKEMLCMR